jgi:hypothetical protein
MGGLRRMGGFKEWVEGWTVWAAKPRFYKYQVFKVGRGRIKTKGFIKTKSSKGGVRAEVWV